jgi:hypothetical protein
MSPTFLKAFGIGVACIALAVGAIFYMQRGSHMDLPGKIIKVRTVAGDAGSSVAVLDFRITNPSDFVFMIGSLTVVLEDNQGNEYSGTTASEQDAQRMFDGMPLLGPKYSTTPVMRERIPPHTTQDRMVVSMFGAPESKLQERKRFVLRIQEADGNVFEIPESK